VPIVIWLRKYDVTGFDDEVKEKMEGLIGEKGISSLTQFEYLITMMREYSDSLKAPFYWQNGVAAIFLTPPWVQFIKWLYDNKVKSTTDAVMLLVAITISLVYAYQIYKIIVLIYNFDYIKSKQLLETLNEIYLAKLPDEKK
jgi:hypothetical protein